MSESDLEPMIFELRSCSLTTEINSDFQVSLLKQSFIKYKFFGKINCFVRQGALSSLGARDCHYKQE